MLVASPARLRKPRPQRDHLRGLRIGTRNNAVERQAHSLEFGLRTLGYGARSDNHRYIKSGSTLCLTHFETVKGLLRLPRGNAVNAVANNAGKKLPRLHWNADVPYHQLVCRELKENTTAACCADDFLGSARSRRHRGQNRARWRGTILA